MEVTNTLAYYDMATIIAEKSFKDRLGPFQADGEGEWQVAVSHWLIWSI